MSLLTLSLLALLPAPREAAVDFHTLAARPRVGRDTPGAVFI